MVFVTFQHEVMKRLGILFRRVVEIHYVLPFVTINVDFLVNVFQESGLAKI